MVKMSVGIPSAVHSGSSGRNSARMVSLSVAVKVRICGFSNIVSPTA
jgi:hypothetical protein